MSPDRHSSCSTVLPGQQLQDGSSSAGFLMVNPTSQPGSCMQAGLHSPKLWVCAGSMHGLSKSTNWVRDSNLQRQASLCGTSSCRCHIWAGLPMCFRGNLLFFLVPALFRCTMYMHTASLGVILFHHISSSFTHSVLLLAQPAIPPAPFNHLYLCTCSSACHMQCTKHSTMCCQFIA